MNEKSQSDYDHVLIALQYLADAAAHLRGVPNAGKARACVDHTVVDLVILARTACKSQRTEKEDGSA